MPREEQNPGEAKQKALDLAMKQIEKQFGKGAIMKMGDAPHVSVDAISTGSITLDHALGIGGIPRGRVVEIFGPESSGKTTLATQIIAEAQKTGGQCAFIDAEHAFDPTYARKLGVDVDALLVSQPDTGEQALEICDLLMRSGALDVIVIDSVAALVPRAEIEGAMGDSVVGVQARLMSQALRKLTGTISRTRTVLIFINQIREKIGVMFGSPETTTGGRALKFYASVRMDIRRIGAIKEGQDVVGNRTRVKVVKNKVAPPFREAEFDIIYGEGVSQLGELIDLAIENDVLQKSGSWYSYGDQKVGQGRDAAKQWLKDHPEQREEVKARVKEALGMTGTPGAEAADEDAVATNGQAAYLDF
ncbi:MAG TPA: recombinase RecA [Rubricoccaceae bacterium]|nr:recombinase RecA [Rubricoccaceae bacterium]